MKYEILKQKVVEYIGENKVKRRDIIVNCGITNGQLSGLYTREQKSGGSLKFSDGLFYVEN